MQQSIRPYEGRENVGEKIKIYHHLDLNPQEKQFLKDTILKIREKQLIRAGEDFSDFRVNESQLDYLIDCPNRFTIIVQDAENNGVSYEIYVLAQNGETVFREIGHTIFTPQETLDNIDQFRDLHFALKPQIEAAAQKLQAKYVRYITPGSYQIPSSNPKNPPEVADQTRALIKSFPEEGGQAQNGMNFSKISNGKPGSKETDLDYSNEPSTPELEAFLTDEVIKNRVIYCPNIRVDALDEMGMSGYVSGYFFICEDQGGKARTLARVDWDAGRSIQIIDGMPAISHHDLFPYSNGGLKYQVIKEENCPVTHAFLETRRQKGKEEIEQAMQESFESKKLE